MAPSVNKYAENISNFPHFDILSGDLAYSDHYYMHSNGKKKVQDCFNNPTSAVSRNIAKEWKILGKDLPESIYVRVYEKRIDLLRALIVGAAGTPYHDGLFFFDIVLPSDYPKQPPQVYYHSHGLRLNPNLYASGKVCLSLINTWYGKGVELWTPAHSTILQLLVSIQGLVLNDKPYFNEPGYEVGLNDRRWLRRSMAYNEDAFIFSCKTMLYILRKPPNVFKSFVVEHFREHGDFILAAIRAYRNGDAIVGQYKEVESEVSSPSLQVPYKFMSNLEKIHEDLRLTFMGIDTSPPKMKNCIELESRRKDVQDDSNQGLLSKAFGMIKKIFE